MIDTRFFRATGSYSLEQLAALTQCELKIPPHKDASKLNFNEPAPLEEAQSHNFSLYHNSKYKSQFSNSKAGACFVCPEGVKDAPHDMSLLISNLPHRSFAVALTALYSNKDRISETLPSHINTSSQIGLNTIIEPNVIIKKNVKIGENCFIGANCVIEEGVEIGHNTQISAHVTLSHSIIGNNVTIFTGVRIGQAGFGFAMDKKGFISIPQLGRVIIEDNVEIGANSTIDRGSLRDTVIGAGSRLDNLVMIGHNVILGKRCVLVAQAGIAGSTILGDNVIVAGQVGISGHLTIGNNVQIGAKSGVMQNVKDGEIIAGIPALPIKQFLRSAAILNRLSKKEDLK